MVRAIDSLSTRGILATCAGTATKAATYLLRFAEVTTLGGVTPTPPPAPGGVATVVSKQHQCGVVPTPPQQPGLWPDPRAQADRFEGFEHSTSTVIDRLLNASERQFRPEELRAARDHLHGYMCKFSREPDSHPPDAKVVAQFLSCGLDVGGWPRLQGLLQTLMIERQKPGYSYAWFVTVALQRIHQIEPAQLKARRAALKLVRQNSQAEVDDLHHGIQALAARMGSTRR